MKAKHKKLLATATLSFGGVGAVMAQSSPPPGLNSLVVTVVVASVVVFLAMSAALVGTTVLILKLLKARGLQIDLSLPEVSLGGVWERFVGMRPAKKLAAIDTPLDHNYDGIIELDNAAPPIFNFIFYGTIVFSIVYLLVYHVFDLRPLMIEEYKEEIAQAELRKGSGEEVETLNETTARMADADLSVGKDIYTANCAACHGNAGEGKVGPNLTDEYWIHGGSFHDVFKTIKYGVPSKGMIPWKSQLNAKQIQDVSGYVKSLAGTNPPNPKAPEGEKYVEAASAAGDSTSVVN